LTLTAMTEILAPIPGSGSPRALPSAPPLTLTIPASQPSQSLAVGICAGAGGFALGVRDAGFTTSLLFERDPWAQKTLAFNGMLNTLPNGWEKHRGDITKVDWAQIGEPVALLFGGVPCQPFSQGGAHRAHADERNLFPELLRAVGALQPQAIIVENVPGLLRPAFSRYWEYITLALSHVKTAKRSGESWRSHRLRLRHLKQAGVTPDYSVVYQVLDAADFGVPQHRKRVFIVATRAPLAPYTFPHPTHFDPKTVEGRSSAAKRWVTVREALRTLPRPAGSEATSAYNHWRIPGAREYPGHTGSHPHRPAKTVKAGVHGVAGGENTVLTRGGVRYFTLREAATIQSFPLDHWFLGARSHVTRQIGNAVPPQLAKAVAAPLRLLLNRAAIRAIR